MLTGRFASSPLFSEPREALLAISDKSSYSFSVGRIRLNDNLSEHGKKVRKFPSFWEGRFEQRQPRVVSVLLLFRKIVGDVRFLDVPSFLKQRHVSPPFSRTSGRPNPTQAGLTGHPYGLKGDSPRQLRKPPSPVSPLSE